MTVAQTDPGLRFWLHYVDGCGGVTESGADGTLIMLPSLMAAEFELPDELVVTADPDVAHEDGAVLLTTGHPVLTRAADAVLTDGDVGIDMVAAPAGPAPDTDTLQDAIREQVPVDHGRIDVVGLPTRVDRPILRVGALVTYTVSAEEYYQERLECWVDAISGLPLRPDDASRLARAARADGPATAPASIVNTATGALVHVHHILNTAAEQRRGMLSAQASRAHQRELAHARSYYDDALQSLERRRATADASRAALLAARAASTQDECARRLLEIDEKYQAQHEIRPYRLHVVLVPGWRVPVDIRRGARRYPFAFDWLAPLSTYAAERCPRCHAGAPLLASKTCLGCQACLASSPA
ncbi:MAG: hypothetical protein JO100_13230 [Pseudonocardia sp.]|nr:hypothetical protein [Pseudonocardia sp.]